MINEFENRKIKNNVCEPIEASRIVASYRDSAGPICRNDDEKLYAWLKSIGVSEEDADWIVEIFVHNGKYELEANLDD